MRGKAADKQRSNRGRKAASKAENKKKAGQPTFTVRELAEMLGCPFEGDGEVRIKDVSSLEEAGEGDLVFLARAKHRKALEETKASAAVIPPGEAFRRIPVLVSETPQLAFVRAVEIFFKPYRLEPGVHPTAWVSPTAKLGKGVAVGALSYIGDEVEVGEGTVIFPLVAVYPRVRIGKRAVLHSHVSIREGVQIGNRVIIHNGAVIGSDGFGYVKREDGSYRKIPQKGTVVIEDDVEIGASTAVDRAALGKTIIRRGAKIDNLVQVAHNVDIGENAVLAGQAGIAGSSRVGKNAILGGQAGVADHVNIGDNVIIAAQSGVHKDIPAGAIVAGTPHLDIKESAKIWALLPQLYDFVKDMKRLKARLEDLEKLLRAKPPT